MQINLSGHHIEITDALRDYVAKKFSRLERHFDNITQAHVILSLERERKQAEAEVHVSGGNLFANAESQDMYAAIDALTDKLDRQIKKHKEKRIAHNNRIDGDLFTTGP